MCPGGDIVWGDIVSFWTRKRTEPNRTEPQHVRKAQAELRRTGTIYFPNRTEPINFRKVRNRNESDRTGFLPVFRVGWGDRPPVSVAAAPRARTVARPRTREHAFRLTHYRIKRGSRTLPNTAVKHLPNTANTGTHPNTRSSPHRNVRM